MMQLRGHLNSFDYEIALCPDNTNHSDCKGDYWCRKEEATGSKKCSDCSNGKACGGNYHGVASVMLTTITMEWPGNYECFCGSDHNGVASCHAHHDCIENAACESGSSLGTTKCKKCDQGWSCGGAGGGDGDLHKCEEGGETNAKDGWHATQVQEQGPKSVQSAPAAAAADHAKMAGASATVELCRGWAI